jgi:hypothetical protein
VLSHRSTAILHELSAHPIEVTAPSRQRIPGLVVHQSDRIERTHFRGIPVAPRAPTTVDLKRTADEATVKRALRQARFGKAELERLPNRIIALDAEPPRSPLEDEARDFVVAGGPCGRPLRSISPTGCRLARSSPTCAGRSCG